MVTGHCGRDWSVAFCGKPNYRGVCRFPPLFKISTELTAVRHVGLHIAVGRICDSLNPQSTPQSCHTLTLTMTRPQRLGGVETSASDANISKRKRFDLSNTRGASGTSSTLSVICAGVSLHCSHQRGASTMHDHGSSASFYGTRTGPTRSRWNTCKR